MTLKTDIPGPRVPMRRGFTYRVWRRSLRHTVRLRGTPRSVAWGLVIGLLVGFSPTIGLQIFIAIALATYFKVSRPAAILPVWITNPLTIPPIYALTYYLGSFFYTGPAHGQVHDLLKSIAANVRQMEFYQVFDLFREFFRVGWDVFIPMWIGGFILGAASALIAYPVTVWTLERFHHFRLERRQHRRERMLERQRQREAKAAAAVSTSFTQ